MIKMAASTARNVRRDRTVACWPRFLAISEAARPIRLLMIRVGSAIPESSAGPPMRSPVLPRRPRPRGRNTPQTARSCNYPDEHSPGGWETETPGYRRTPAPCPAAAVILSRETRCLVFIKTLSCPFLMQRLRKSSLVSSIHRNWLLKGPVFEYFMGSV